MSPSVAIQSIGVAMPPIVRTNDFWSPELTDKWMAGRRRGAEIPMPPADTPAVHKVRMAMAEVAQDPFCGSVKRHVLPKDTPPSALEEQAARDALDRAGVDVAEIDFILHYGTTGDFLVHPNACLVHERLGLPKACLSISVDGVCNAFQLQLHLADQLLQGGRYKKGLLVQSALFSWLNPEDAPYAPWCGDAATAQVVALGERGGLIADVHRTDSSLSGGVVVGNTAGHWTDGDIYAYLNDKDRSRRMLEGVADLGIAVVQPALKAAGLKACDIDFYASHQASAWFRSVTQDVLGLEHAKSVDTFPWAASVAAANLPLVMATAEREGLLVEGDLIAMYSGGSGVTFSSSILRWGR
ncbi:MAG: 3-oxoacyl-ACP synthase III family protein [Myxococcota bacterium]